MKYEAALRLLFAVFSFLQKKVIRLIYNVLDFYDILISHVYLIAWYNKAITFIVISSPNYKMLPYNLQEFVDTNHDIQRIWHVKVKKENKYIC